MRRVDRNYRYGQPLEVKCYDSYGWFMQEERVDAYGHLSNVQIASPEAPRHELHQPAPSHQYELYLNEPSHLGPDLGHL